MPFIKGHKVNLGKKYPNRKSVVFSKEHRQKLSDVRMGKKLSKETRAKMKKWANTPERKALQSKIGKISAAKRWKNHVKVDKKYKSQYKYIPYKERFKTEKSLEKKRFSNKRYKARKKKAQGSHTFEEWLLLKSLYKNMCLCCKRQEPEIELTQDHIIPLKMKGTDYIDNIQPLCASCNTRKYTKVIDYRIKEGGEKQKILIC